MQCMRLLDHVLMRTHMKQLLVGSITLLLCCTMSLPCSLAFAPDMPGTSGMLRTTTITTTRSTRLWSNNNKLGKAQGVYSRPSAAIERGSGFFVPGLEGPRVRLLVGSLLLVVLCGLISTRQSSEDTLADVIVAVYAGLTILQGVVEQKKYQQSAGNPNPINNSTSSSRTNTAAFRSYSSVWSIPVQDESWKERVEWAMATYLQLTPATGVRLLGPKGACVYSLVRTEEEYTTANADALFSAAYETIQQSNSGRVALSASHPAAAKTARCTILQKVVSVKTGDLCWMVTSNDSLLAAFTKQDLQWLGQLAKYVSE